MSINTLKAAVRNEVKVTEASFRRDSKAALLTIAHLIPERAAIATGKGSRERCKALTDDLVAWGLGLQTAKQRMSLAKQCAERLDSSSGSMKASNWLELFESRGIDSVLALRDALADTPEGRARASAAEKAAAKKRGEKEAREAELGALKALPAAERFARLAILVSGGNAAEASAMLAEASAIAAGGGTVAKVAAVK